MYAYKQINMCLYLKNGMYNFYYESKTDYNVFIALSSIVLIFTSVYLQIQGSYRYLSPQARLL
jgi:hypothetical protein